MENMRKVLRSKIHRATVTHADLEYQGSITIPPELMDAAGLVEYEAVQVWNVSSGSRLETYAIAGQADSHDICINGAAAHHASPGDLIIIACFESIPESALSEHKPRLVFVDKSNRQIAGRIEDNVEIPGPQLVLV